MQEAYPTRTFDVGISEGHAVTFAGGLAKEGLKPYVAIYSAFLQRAYDSIINDVSIARLPVTFCLDRAGLVGEDGVTHHGLFDLAFMRAIPGMVVSAPMDEHSLRNLMFTANNYNDGPFSIRYPRGAGKIVDWHNEPVLLPLGKGRKICDGNDVAILSIGTIGTNVIEACASLHEQGIDVAHYDMIFLKPLDDEILQEVASRYRKIITIEEGTITGGLGGAVAEWLADRNISARLVRLGVADTFVDQGTVKQLHEMCGLDPASIEKEVKLLLKDTDR
jgi:1-deoxy-D-xylulose-5-phosphate synthase